MVPTFFVGGRVHTVPAGVPRSGAVLAAIYCAALCVFGNWNNHLNRIPVIHPIPTNAVRGPNTAKNLGTCVFDR